MVAKAKDAPAKADEGAKGKPAEPAVKPDAGKPKPKRPSEPKLDVRALEAAKPRASEPLLEPAKPKARPSELAIDPGKPKPRTDAVIDPKPRPSELAIARPAKADPPAVVARGKKLPAKGELPADWKALLGKPLTCTWRRSSGHPIEVIDWAKLPEREAWLDDVFGDCDPARHFTGLIAKTGDVVEWTSAAMWPVALLGQQLGGEGQLEAILLVDTTMADSPVYAIEVDGTAIPAKKPQQVAANLAALKLEVVKPEARARATKVDFDACRPKIVAGKIDGDARKLLHKLSGDRDGGSGYLQPHLAKKPRPPEGRDPRWLDALRDELAKSIVAASESYRSETHMLAGTLASFGPPAIPALVAALDTALASYPKHSLDYGVQPVLLALDYLQSDAGIPAALAILARASRPEKSYAIPPVLDYLKPRAADPRIAPVVKKFYKKAAPKKPMHYIDDLEALAKQLDI